MEYFDFFMQAPTQTIQEAIPRTKRFIETNDKIVCSVSGGSDSDIMIDILSNLDTQKKVRYIFCDTGIEMSVTKKHLDKLKQKYGIYIETIRPKEPVPLACQRYGLPFHSKIFSEYIYRLQKYGFKWEDKPFEDLYKEYPNCKAALRWWCNMWGERSMKNINSAKWLKEFMIENPPKFKISQKCCQCAKKAPAHTASKGADITFLGIRKSEGGIRSQTYTSCFANTKNGAEHFPLFFWSDKDKEEYDKKFGVEHSEAYTVYGCKRTGCAGCPFGSRFEKELEMLEKYEPKLYTAVNNIFGQSYDYTRKYRQFKALKEAEKNNDTNQISFDDLEKED